MMADEERPSQGYTCFSKGCQNGYGSMFEAAPEEWFYERGFSTPRNCSFCRDWIRRQCDEKFSCPDCARLVALSANFKISYHKRVGPWVQPEKCKQCERGKVFRPGFDEEPEREDQVEPKKEQLDDFSDIADGIVVEVRQILTRAEDYQHHAGRSRETRQAHIEQHLIDSPYSVVGQVVNGQKKSATSLVGLQGNFSDLLVGLSELLAITDPEITREYQEGSRIVRLSLRPHDMIEVTVLEPLPDGNYEVVTTYDSVTVKAMKIRYGSKSNRSGVK